MNTSEGLPAPVSWRVFVGVPVDEVAREALARAIARLRREVRSGVQWVPPERLHATLAFLGDVTPEQAVAFTAALRPRLAGIVPFVGTVAGLGTFGGPRAPRVLWAGIGAGAESLAAVAARVGETCVALGLRPEARPFHAHVTLGRVRQTLAGRAAAQALARTSPATYGGLPGDAVTIYRSELSPKGPTYIVLNRLALQPPRPPFLDRAADDVAASTPERTT